MIKLLKKSITFQIQWISSMIGLYLIAFILLSALYVQFVYNEEPCPLCLLQRICFINIGLALMMNIKYGNQITNWGLASLSSITGMAVSTRQILLHINDPIGFGMPILGLHLYTWCYIGFVVGLIGSLCMVIMLGIQNRTH